MQAELAWAAILVTLEGDVVGAGAGITQDRRHVQVGPAIHAAMAHDREPAQVDLVLGMDDLLDGRIRRRHDGRADPPRLAAGVLETELDARGRGRQAKRPRAARTTGENVRHDRHAGWLAVER